MSCNDPVTFGGVSFDLPSTSPDAGTITWLLSSRMRRPPFNPVDAPEPPALNSLDEIHIGGHGIRVLRRLADSLEYRASPTGNRLSIGFSAAGSVIAKD